MPGTDLSRWRGPLGDRRGAGPMAWVVAIMLFITALAVTGGLLLSTGLRTVEAGAAGRLGVALEGVAPGERDTAAAAASRLIGAMPGVRHVARTPDTVIAALLTRWTGTTTDVGALSLPVILDVDVPPKDAATMAPRIEQALRMLVPDVHVARQSDWMGAFTALARRLMALAAAVATMTLAATLAIVALAVRGALDTHRPTIEVLHLIGARDREIAALFQRRLTVDTIVAASTGTALAALVAGLLLESGSALGIGGTGAPAMLWIALAALPLIVTLAAWATARIVILRALAHAP